MDVLPKVKERITGAVDNTRSTLENVVSRVKTGKPNILEIPTKHVARFAELNRNLVGR